MKNLFLISKLLFITFLLYQCTSENLIIDGLKVEYTETPLGIDVEKPRFSWQIEYNGEDRGIYQKAYQIIVKDESGDIYWDSEKINSDVSLGIEYEGISLSAKMKYDWTVNVWDQDDNLHSNDSWFETGLMNSSLDAWDGAQWIGGSAKDMVLYTHYLSVFILEYDLKLDNNSGSTKAGFVIGANDMRLMDKNKNIYGLENKKNGSFVKFELDISKLPADPAILNIYRVGYHPEDKADIPFAKLEIPKTLISNANKYEAHHIKIESIFGTLTIYVDGENEANRISPASRSPFGGGGLNINPMGSGGDYISFPMLADIGFTMDPDQKASFSDLTVRNFRAPSNKLFNEDLSQSDYSGIFSHFSANDNSSLQVGGDGYLLDGGSEGVFLVADPSSNSMPMLRTEFQVENKQIDKVRLYVTSRGVYEIYLNGERVGSDYFNPGLTQYNETHLYQTYDITESIKAGSNAVGAMLGEGWWSGNYTFRGNNWNFFGDRQSILAKLEVTYDDGSVEVVATNDQDWKYYNNGPVMYGSFFQGEAYDARKDDLVAGWSTAEYDDNIWSKAANIPLEGTVWLGQIGGMGGSAINVNYDDVELIGQIGDNAKIIKELTALSVDEVRPGVFVYDMGQNMVGVPNVAVTGGNSGDTLYLRYAEVLYPDLEEYGENVGMIMLENIRGALAQDTYILKEGENIIQPHFTFHGYRFLEITGVEEAIPIENVKGLVISSIDELSASYQTSHENVNRLFQNIVWSQYGNFLSIPTDCPQRNERMGWSGDISVFSRTATYLANVDQFFRRHMFAMRDVQYPDGRYPDVAPVDNGFGGILWGSAGITVAWETYQQYRDKAALAEHYQSMKEYMDFLEKGIDEETGVMTAGILGDWLSPEGSKNDNTLLFSAYYVFNLDIMVKVAQVLGNVEDADKYRSHYNDRKAHFNETYIDRETFKTLKSSHESPSFGPGMARIDEKPKPGEKNFMDTQVSYAVPLALGVIDDEFAPQVARSLVEAIQRENVDDLGVTRPEYSLMTGFIGTAWISKALSDHGYEDVAYRLLQQESYPSWLYPVTQGATSIWERLNSYTHENGFGGNNSMNSFNHYSFGAVGQWMMAYSLGIERDEPGFKKFILQPEPDPTGNMDWAKGYYDSMYGRINSSWKVDNGKLLYQATVPPNTEATLYLPASSQSSIKESGQSLADNENIEFVDYIKGEAIIKLKSGNYSFESDL